MKSLKQITKSLRLTLLRKPNLFIQAQSRHRAFASFTNLEAFLQSLPLTRVSPETQHVLTTACVAEYSMGDAPFWSALLTVMYEPLLATMLRTGQWSEDRLQSLLLDFLEILRGLALSPACTNAPGYIRTALTHAVANRAIRARRAPPVAEYDEETTVDRNAPFREDLAFSVAEIRDGRALAEAIALGARTPEVRRRMRATRPGLGARHARARAGQLLQENEVRMTPRAAVSALKKGIVQ